jgi:hypothetical protein
MIDEIFEQLKEAVAKGATLPAPHVPDLEDDLKQFVVRPMTDDEIAFLAARDAAAVAAEKMMARVVILGQLDLLDDATADDIKRDEQTKFHAMLLADLFFWTIQANTSWQFAALHQRMHEGHLVLVGLKPKEARAYYKRQAEAQQMAELIGGEKPGPRLVN